jgi:uncharacterized Ntn-hydrolase superfamily protein
MRSDPTLRYATYSVVARDRETGDLGVAVQTHQMCVGSAVPWLEAGAGAVATQSLTNVRFGPLGLALLRQGIEAEGVVRGLVASDEDADQRQLAVVDSGGRAAAWTGDQCIEYAGHHVGEGFSVQANMMTHATVIEAMSEAFVSASGDLAQRMMAALIAAQAEDGDIRGMQSASLNVVPGDPPRYRDPAEWRPIFDLRVDENSDPLKELERLVRLRRASLIDREGHRQLEEGSFDRALTLFERAKELAPELEELVYWQALALAESKNRVQEAAQWMKEMLAQEERGELWRDLIVRIERAGILSRAGVADELIAALEAMNR